MVETINRECYFKGLVTLFHLLVHADGIVDDKEILMGEFMCKHEKIDEYEFNYYLKKYSEKEDETVLNDCITALKKCDYQWRIKCIAWMSLIANSHGFMAQEEWRLLFRIYSVELQLKLEEILYVQRNLPKPL